MEGGLLRIKKKYLADVPNKEVFVVTAKENCLFYKWECPYGQGMFNAIILK